MKTLTVVISDEAAAKLSEHAAETRRPAEELAARALEDAYAEDWFADLPVGERAAIEASLAQARRGEFATDAEVDEAFERFNR